jgi:hypothetical protein
MVCRSILGTSSFGKDLQKYDPLRSVLGINGLAIMDRDIIVGA